MQDPTLSTTRVYCTNDGCDFKDMRVEGAQIPKCPECGAQMETTPAHRPQRQSRTY